MNPEVGNWEFGGAALSGDILVWESGGCDWLGGCGSGLDLPRGARRFSLQEHVPM
jgi:hypothetical protein